MPLPSISSTSSGSSVSNMYGPNFLTGIGSALAQDQDMTNYLSGFTPSLQLQGGMMSQQPGGMVHNVSGQDMQQPIGGHGQLSSNGQQMPPIQYPPDMNIPNYANLKMEKAGEMYPSPPASSAVAAHNSAGPGNGNSAGPGNGNSAGPGNGNGNGNGTNSLSPDSPPVGGQSSLSSVPGSPAKSCTSREDIDSSTEGDGSKKSPKKRLINVPEDQKDEAYWEKRRKNNESAKRSRESRRIKEEQIAMKVVVLEQENLALKTEIDILKTEVENLRRMLYNPGPILPNHM
nr:hypothetical protein BaRGS_020999 [Batillaria attramentaria]